MCVCTVSYRGQLRLVNTNQVQLPSDLEYVVQNTTFLLYLNENGLPQPPLYTNEEGLVFMWTEYGNSAPEWYLA